MSLVANARMYAVTPAVEAAWRTLLSHIASDAGVDLAYEPYPAPQPLEVLWRRPDLGCVQMCGFPIALDLAAVEPIAAPIPAAAWAGGRSVYRSDLIVRRDAPFRSLEETFDGTLGWTVEHSHSGFNALRHHLLSRRPAGQASAFRATHGPLVTARAVLDRVLDGTITVGPLDAYWHALIRRHEPDLLAGVRVIDSTDLAPMPSFVMAAGQPATVRERLAEAFVRAHRRAWFPSVAEPLVLTGFSAVTRDTFAQTLQWDHDARSAGYPRPA